MASDRILIVRVLGIGYADEYAEPLTLTSRAGLPYLPTKTINGVIAEMGAQLSSEIAMFGSLGSDPTTYFTVLSTEDTRTMLLSRATNPLRNSGNNAMVRTSRYVTPTPTPTVYCDDTTLLSAGDLVRIGGSALRVTSVNSSVDFDAEYIFGCHPVPIPLQIFGTSNPLGAVVNGIRIGGAEYPSGGIEQLPIIISTAPSSATSTVDEEVIFRGVVSKVGIDTSAKATNQIKVDCSSIMGVIRNTPFRPVPMQPFVWLEQHNASETAPDVLNPRQATNLKLEAVWDPRLQGPPWEATFGNYYDTRIGLFQLRKDKSGGVFSLAATVENGDYYTIRAQSDTEAVEGVVNVSGFPWYFQDGVYARGVAGDLSLNYERTNNVPDGALTSQITSGNGISTEWRAEVSFVALSLVDAIKDLIFGTYGDANGVQGCRPAGMAAWLPFGFASVTEILSYGEMREVFGTDTQGAMPTLTVNGEAYTILPYLHADAKTVGDVLDWVLKRTGAFMVYDRGRLRFGSWANSGVWPREVNDTGLAEPRIGLEFDRNNAIQQVEVDFAQSVKNNEIVRSKIPVTNTDRMLSASGKNVALGNFTTPFQSNGLLESSQSLQMAIAMIGRYSRPAAVVEVTYRDAVFDLEVGEFISFSSDYIPNALGQMGVQSARGFVIKAERSWKTPTTTYTLWLYGYVSVSNRLSLVSSTGVWRDEVASQVQRIQPKAYCSADARPGAPISDAESFAQTLARTPKGKIPLQLLDEFGTPYGVTSILSGVDLVNDYLLFDDTNFDGVPRTGDVFVIADAATVDGFDTILDTAWDAFQADTVGQVASKDIFSNPWMV